MPGQPIQPGATFRFSYLWPEEDLFVLAFPCDLVPGDALFRRFNVKAAFIEPEWYRFNLNSQHLERIGEWDFCHE